MAAKSKAEKKLQKIHSILKNNTKKIITVKKLLDAINSAKILIIHLILSSL